MTTYYSYYESPLGTVLLTASDSALTGLHFVGGKYYPVIAQTWKRDAACAIIELAIRQLNGYFAGTRADFNLPLELQGTAFQRNVWDALLHLKFGETVAYAQIAQRIGNENAVRAVGAANGRNPISIIVPCHRVVGTNGDLTGYSGGLARKKLLLTWEAARASFSLAAP